MRRWVSTEAPTLATPIGLGIESVEGDGDAVLVTFRERVEPRPQPVAGRQVACHLHGVVGPTD